VAVRPLVGHMTGVDLSSGMVAEAHKKQCYDRLEVGELNLFLQGEAAERRRYDLVVAADVLVYMADFAGAAAKVAEVLTPDGLFAFTVETHTGEGMILGETLRYAHAPAHVAEVLGQAGFTELSSDSVSIRSEKGVPVASLVVVARHNQPVASTG
jgi:predicted TPR repeat methyltransferase